MSSFNLTLYEDAILTPEEINLLRYFARAQYPSPEQQSRWPIYTNVSTIKQNIPQSSICTEDSKQKEVKSSPKLASIHIDAKVKAQMTPNEVVKEMLREKRRLRELEQANISSASLQKRPKFVASLESAVSTVINKEAFPESGLLWSGDWDPSQVTESLVVSLPEFGLDNKQTLVLRMTVPESSEKWGVSICPKNHDSFMNVLYHINPRSKERGGVLIQNDRREGIWGSTVSERLHGYPPMFGLTFDVSIQIDEWGFHVALSGEYQLSFRHRHPIEESLEENELILEVPRTDDYSHPQSLKLHQVWWGNKRPHPNKPTSDVLEASGNYVTVNQVETMFFTNLHVSNLPVYEDPSEEANMREKLEELYSIYGFESIKIITGKGYGFVNLKSSENAAEALNATNGYQFMGVKLKVTRARSRV